MNIQNLTQPAYPIVPLQDNFGKLVVPVPGLSKLEHFALELYKVYLNNADQIEYATAIQEEHNEAGNTPRSIDTFVMDLAINDSIEFLNLLEEKIKTLQNEKSTPLAII